MVVFLALILVIAGISLALNAAYILHELGWLPHGKRRDRPLVRRSANQTGRIPTIEEARINDEDFQTHGPLTLGLRRHGHPEVYEFEDPEPHLRAVLQTFRDQPTPSHRDDVLNLLNVITTRGEADESLEALVDETIGATQEPVLPAGSEK